MDTMVQEKISASPVESATRERVASLNARWRTIQAERVLKLALLEEFPGRIAVSSSFGTEAAVLLHLISRVYKAAPVLFIDTGKHFPETIEYRDELIERFGLRDVRVLRPKPSDLLKDDPNGDLHSFDQDACCAIRKVAPLEQSMTEFDAWITGRKRYQNATREDLPIFELDTTGKVKVNPLANWSPTDVEAYFKEHELPHHPLEAQGYKSIGCAPCTTPVAEGEDPRAGRWRESEKTECGIHVTADGKVIRTRLIDTTDRG